MGPATIRAICSAMTARGCAAACGESTSNPTSTSSSSDSTGAQNRMQRSAPCSGSASLSNRKLRDKPSRRIQRPAVRPDPLAHRRAGRAPHVSGRGEEPGRIQGALRLLQDPRDHSAGAGRPSALGIEGRQLHDGSVIPRTPVVDRRRSWNRRRSVKRRPIRPRTKKRGGSRDPPLFFVGDHPSAGAPRDAARIRCAPVPACGRRRPSCGCPPACRPPGARLRSGTGCGKCPSSPTGRRPPR